MARYIDADELLVVLNGLYEHHLTMYNYAADGATKDCIDAVIAAPDADVVPKGELEKLQNKCLILEQKRLTMYDRLVFVENARTETAREICEEIEQEIKCHGVTYSLRKIAEIKKRYAKLK